MLTLVSEAVENYAAQHTTPLPPLLQELVITTEESMEAPEMLCGQVEGTLLQFLVGALGAKRVLEIGMFTGFSALMMAAALPDDGRLITCDINPRAEAVARRFFRRSPHGHKIEIRMGPALETIRNLEGPFDFVFIDADKPTYPAYYERSVELLAPNGMIAIDNVLSRGRVVHPEEDAGRIMAAFNERVRTDSRVTKVMLPLRDGVTLIRRSSKG